MSGARKIMNPSEEIVVTEQDLAEAQTLLDSLEFKDGDELRSEYQQELDKYCKEFDASSYGALMARADMAEFSPEICSKILRYYSFITKRTQH